MILFMFDEVFEITLVFLDISIPINGSISISSSSVESVSPTYRGEIERVCLSAQFFDRGFRAYSIFLETGAWMDKWELTPSI